MKTDYAINSKKTDEEVYQELKKSKSDSTMDAEEWKKLRLIQLNKERKIWSK